MPLNEGPTKDNDWFSQALEGPIGWGILLAIGGGTLGAIVGGVIAGVGAGGAGAIERVVHGTIVGSTFGSILGAVVGVAIGRVWIYGRDRKKHGDRT
jgi:hypothetical protein